MREVKVHAGGKIGGEVRRGMGIFLRQKVPNNPAPSFTLWGGNTLEVHFYKRTMLNAFILVRQEIRKN